ncbi:MAG: diguanylate cyclase [Candidatus Omnitrophica bacterium]|nr:diguanylate cyclase [Candidatus Omnitrophota bacterium]
MSTPKIKRILIISSDKSLIDVLTFCFDGWGYEVFLQHNMAPDIDVIKRVSPDVIVVDIDAAHKSEIGICRTLKDDFMTAFVPVIAIINKRQLRQQLLDIRQGVDDYLIKPPDPLDLRTRVEMAIKRSQYSIYTSPLTGLPGGRIIEETIKDKIKEGFPLSFAHLDIDNFKYFNDAYGYLRGDRVIMQTAYLLYATIKRFGNNRDFIGHIGGDDFMFISTPEKCAQICHNFIQLFEKVTPFHYSSKERECGFIVAKDRARKIKEIPLMSISIAIVNKSGPQHFKNAVEINEKMAEIKCYLKSMPGSKFMADRRSATPEYAQGPQFRPKGEKTISLYKPLGQILIERSLVTPEQLDEALKTHWKRGVQLGEILKELKLIRDIDLQEALKAQGSIPLARIQEQR